MASSLAAQLQQLSALRPSTHTTSHSQIRRIHAQSILFTPEVAAAQSHTQLYSICNEGFLDLCTLDDRFRLFRNGIFSEQSISVDRDTKTKSEISLLDSQIRSFLGRVSPFLQLRSAVKSVEWLVRRFRLVLSGFGMPGSFKCPLT